MFSSSSKSPSPSQVRAYASQGSEESNYNNPPPLYGDISGSAVSSQDVLRGEPNKYEKQRHQGDYIPKVGICQPPPAAYLQLSSGSSQSVAVDPHNRMLEQGVSSGAQQRYRRKRNQPYGREYSNHSAPEDQRRSRMRYKKNKDID